MENLQRYFGLFDESRTSTQAMEDLFSLFSDDMSFVLNGDRKEGIESWKMFMKMFYEYNSDIKHMFEGWERVEGTDQYQTKWAVCGKKKTGEVFTQEGIDIARLDESGKICYLENVPADSAAFQQYKQI
ncbi:nuclear transport factor 2 family protein [Priestia koreensis]|uniref:nuclear transport factor 2 family protein n=1 Tax=Priestia koreensis TaxID=284581 RepID=UPI001F5939FE|nr:nuclear transport factor 2 family protein [Priestia koreensis]UNL87030.1 nuclear transport factor 2 family protein [Priestia koreensis]